MMRWPPGSRPPEALAAARAPRRPSWMSPRAQRETVPEGTWLSKEPRPSQRPPRPGQSQRPPRASPVVPEARASVRPPAPSVRPAPPGDGLVPATMPEPVIHDGPLYEEQIAALQEELAHAQDALDAATAALALAREAVLRDAEGELVRLAVAIARRVVGEELRLRPEIYTQWAAAELAAASGTDTVALGRDLAARIPEPAWDELRARGVQVVVDPALPPMACDVRGAVTRVDASAEGRLDSVAEALGVTPQGSR